MTDVRYKIDIDGKQADAELARLHSGATSLAGSEDRLTAALKRNEAALADTAMATAAASKETSAFQQRINKLPDILGKQAAAISLVTSSMAGQNGEVGKMVAGAGQMAAAYGAGGPFALALVGGLALVSALSSHLEKLNREQDEAIAKLYGPVEAAIDQRKKAERDIAALRRDAAGPETSRQAFERVQKEIDGVDAQIKALTVSRNAMKVGTAGYDETRKQHQDQIVQLTKTIELLEVKQNLEQGKAAQGSIKPKGAGGSVRKEKEEEIDVETWAQLERGRLMKEHGEERAKMRLAEHEEAKRLAADSAAVEVKLAETVAAEKARIDERAKQERESIRLADVAEMQGYASTVIGITASASQQLIADIVGQQDKALERFGISIMAQAGQALVSYGAQAIGRGILEASSPLTAPLAPASFAAGGVLLGAGIGLGGVAGGLGALLGGSGSSSGPSERGVPSGFSGGATGGGGGTSITIVYGGASGPTADHAVTAISDTLTRASARNALRDEVR